MNRSLLHPVMAPSQALPSEASLPSPSLLSPAELAQAYRDWLFRPVRAASIAPLSGRTKR